MDQSPLTPEELAFYEKSIIPLIVYCFKDNHIQTLAVSEGIVSMFNLESLDEAYQIMNHDMYKSTHPDDIAGVANAALLFATQDAPFDVLYRSLIREEYHVIHACGSHISSKAGRYSVIWYTDEGPYEEGKTSSEAELRQNYSRTLRDNFIARSYYHDNLTGLPGMSYFFRLAEHGCLKLQQEGFQPAIIFFNLSGIKYFNKKYGFDEGDRLIRSVSALLVRYFGQNACSRFGQDHFAVYTKLEGLEETLRSIFDEMLECNEGNSLPLKAGIYVEPPELTEISLACDRAKHACSMIGSVFESDFSYFSMTMMKDEEKRQYILDHFDQAIEEGWIVPFYQPIVRAANGCVSDEEALARWIDPEKGMLSPGDFIPVLEDSMLLYRMDLHILDRILIKMKKQAEAGHYVVPISLNLSRTDFDMCDMVEEVTRRVDDAGIGRDKLTIEITESAVGSDLDFIRDQVENFQRLGFKVWMDDFGSGYSSLDVLQSIRFDLIKLDMRFMQQLEESEESRIILTELVRMIIGLGIDTVAEGVETEKQKDFLREIGCTKLQGYYYCKPISFETLLKRYEEGKQIGFENPAESEYFSTIGRINLYDLAVMTGDESDDISDYFSTLPMAILESDGKIMWINRCNAAYKSFIEHNLDVQDLFAPIDLETITPGKNQNFVRSLKSCVNSGGRVFFDEQVGESTLIHAMIRQIAVNPVTGITSLAIVILAVKANAWENITYSQIASALSADYLFLYCVDLKNEDFIEYKSDPESGTLSTTRRGKDFFRQSYEDAKGFIYEDDFEPFTQVFTRENILRSMDEYGAFTLSYRLIIDGVPTHVNMKAARMGVETGYIIIGVNVVDAQAKREQDYNQQQAQKPDTIDTLTGIRNKNAYEAIEEELNREIRDGSVRPFAIVVFDIHNLKGINDARGHHAGDRILKRCCSTICQLFKHSPVFRMGSDEFLVIARGEDYENADYIVESFNEENRRRLAGDEPVMACGMAPYQGEESVADVYRRADARLFFNKKDLKS